MGRSGRKTVVMLLLGALVAGTAPSSPAAPSGASARGVTLSRVKIGIHVPFTGASPVPSSSMQAGSDLYFRWLRHKGEKIHGRNVGVVIKNDNGNPSQAVQVCKEMVERENVFLLVGVSDPASTQACARYAESVGVPYVTMGRSELRLKRFRRFFAISMSLDDQGPLLADFLVDRRRARRRENGIVTYNSSLYDGVHRRLVNSIERRGADVTYDRRISVTAGTTEAQQVVQEMALAGVDNVVLIVRPVFLIQVVDQAESQSYDPSWLASDDPLTLDTVAKAACTQAPDTFDGARAFSAIPAFHDRDDFDRRYDRAVRATDTGPSDSTVWLGWAVGRRIARMLDIGGRDLTRKRFSRRVGDERLGPKIMSKVRFGTRDNFGAHQVHVLRADCSRDRWVTARSFASDF